MQNWTPAPDCHCLAENKSKTHFQLLSSVSSVSSYLCVVQIADHCLYLGFSSNERGFSHQSMRQRCTRVESFLWDVVTLWCQSGGGSRQSLKSSTRWIIQAYDGAGWRPLPVLCVYLSMENEAGSLSRLLQSQHKLKAKANTDRDRRCDCRTIHPTQCGKCQENMGRVDNCRDGESNNKTKWWTRASCAVTTSRRLCISSGDDSEHRNPSHH